MILAFPTKDLYGFTEMENGYELHDFGKKVQINWSDHLITQSQ